MHVYTSVYEVVSILYHVYGLLC